ncbi:MAG: polyphenol oxidase family protein, partial [Alphaproteobacteria bacterium]|nr:polyphenol oxidase family protein [Alphaproteobacteria bacterium]
MIRADNLERADAVRHGFFTREGGVSRGIYSSLNCGLGSADSPDRVALNRARALAMLGLDGAPLCTAHQVHGTEVGVVVEPWPPERRPKVDAMVTSRSGIALGILTADCAPVLMADAEARVIGAAHAGWRGALAGVLEAAVEAMVELGARRERIAAAVGPAIGQPSYQVGPEFPAPFLAADEGRYLFDLAGYAAERLRAAGLGRCEQLAHDTVAEDDLFFSYRRSLLRGEDDYGRTLSAIAL